MSCNRKILLSAFSDEEVHELFRLLYAMAMGGDLGAMKVLLQYLVGKPTAAPNPDRVNHEEWAMRMEQPRREELEEQAENQMPHSVMVQTHRILDIAKVHEVGATFQSGLSERDTAAVMQSERAERRAERKEERQRRKENG